MKILIYTDLNLISLKTIINKFLGKNVEIRFLQINRLAWEVSIINIKSHDLSDINFAIFWQKPLGNLSSPPPPGGELHSF